MLIKLNSMLLSKSHWLTISMLVLVERYGQTCSLLTLAINNEQFLFSGMCVSTYIAKNKHAQYRMWIKHRATIIKTHIKTYTIINFVVRFWDIIRTLQLVTRPHPLTIDTLYNLSTITHCNAICRYFNRCR